jgi:hypothetical protein
MQRLTTVTSICALKRPRHIEDWALLELMEHGGCEVETVGGVTRWRNVHGYRATGAETPVRDDQ